MLSNSERIALKSQVLVLLAIVLFATEVASVHAPVSIQASVARDFNVVFEFTNIDSITYVNLKNNALIMNETTVPEKIWRNLADRGLVRSEYYNPSVSFNDTTRTIRSVFNLRGPDVISSTINRAVSVETFTANTTWRKFYLNVTPNFVFNFTKTLATPLSDWDKIELLDAGIRYEFANATAGIACSFVLPKDAGGAFVVGETIVFDMAYVPSWEDNLINSPILILIALAVVGVIIFVYRKVR